MRKMVKILSLCLFSWLSLYLFSGCSLIKAGASEAFGQTKKNKKNICFAIEKISMARLQGKDYYMTPSGQKVAIREAVSTTQTVVGMNGGNVNYDTGEVDFGNITYTNMLFSKLHCPIFKPIDTNTLESKSFAVNGNGSDDFKVKITKKYWNAQKLQKGKIIEDNIKITYYEPDNIMVASYKGKLYPANSNFIKNEKQRLKNEYEREKNKLQLACFKVAGAKYCDGDLVRIDGMTLMVRVSEIGNGIVQWQLYYYENGSGAYYLADSHFQMQMKMKAQKVIGNDYLQEIEEKNKIESFRLKLGDVKTFKEW